MTRKALGNIFSCDRRMSLRKERYKALMATCARNNLSFGQSRRTSTFAGLGNEQKKQREQTDPPPIHEIFSFLLKLRQEAMFLKTLITLFSARLLLLLHSYRLHGQTPHT